MATTTTSNSSATSTTTRRVPVTTSPVERGRPLPVAFTVVLALVVASATLYGVVANPYPAPPGVDEALPALLRGQDLLTLVTVPVLVWAATRARGGSFGAHVLWSGLVLYYAYTYLMYAFSPFTPAFLAYVAIIGMSTYALLDGVLRVDVHAVAPAFDDAPRHATGWFLVAVGSLFVVIWLGMILPAIPDGLPDGRMTYDIASAVHILDLAWVLPLLLAAGVMLLRDHPAGPLLAGVMLCMKVTLALAMLSMSFAFVDEPNLGQVGLWTTIAVVSVGWLVIGVRRAAPVPTGWLRRSLWPHQPAAEPLVDEYAGG